MTTIDLVTEPFWRIDDWIHRLSKHPQAVLWPSEIATLGRLHAPKGIGNRAFYRWLTRDSRPLFPGLPEPHPVVPVIQNPSAVDAVILVADPLGV